MRAAARADNLLLDDHRPCSRDVPNGSDRSLVVPIDTRDGYISIRLDWACRAAVVECDTHVSRREIIFRSELPVLIVICFKDELCSLGNVSEMTHL